MMADALAVRWESLLVALATFALALWAFRRATPAAPPPGKTPPEGVALQILRPGAAPEIVEVKDGCVLGRGQACTIVFDDATVSKLHARFKLDGSEAVIEDLDSTNGTLLNGRRLTGPAPLRRGDRIGLGANQIVFLGMAPSKDN
jgi:pSer/pThr/pTyr-binding forkhead associated (FHA) protein